MIRRLVIGLTVILVVGCQLAAISVLSPFVGLIAVTIIDLFPRSGGPPTPIATADLSGSGNGSLVSATTNPGLTRTMYGKSLTAARVLYRSTDGDTDEPTVVSGSVFVPQGTAPAGGWPVVAFAHGTLGIDGACGPSRSENLKGLVAAAVLLTERGYAVALPDYQGLGAKGIHPYTDARTAGLNLIDSVRALRLTFPDVSDRWAAMGDSQGGGASWSANEQAAAYAPELNLVGAVASSPAADVSGMVDKVEAGTMTSDQMLVWQLMVESMARVYPGALNRDDFRSGAAANYWNVLSACDGPAVYQRGEAAKQVTNDDFRIRTPEAAAQVRSLLDAWALPQRPLSAPLYVWYGGVDTFIDPQWNTDAIARACATGGTVTIDFDPTKGHSQVDVNRALGWIGDRFMGVPAQNDC
jgi:hypothetical protein